MCRNLTMTTHYKIGRKLTVVIRHANVTKSGERLIESRAFDLTPSKTIENSR